MSKPNGTLTYKGYIGSAELSEEDRCLVGKILHIDDLIMYDATTYPGLERAFQKAVKAYLTTCARAGKEPQKSFSGNLNVRISPSTHAKAARLAMEKGITLNEFINNAIESQTMAVNVSALPIFLNYGSPAFTQTLVTLGVTEEGTSRHRLEIQASSTATNLH